MMETNLDETINMSDSSLTESHFIMFGLIRGIVTPAIAIPGTIGNILTLVVLSSKNLGISASLRQLLKMLAVFDASLLFITVVLFGIPDWSTSFSNFYQPLLIPILLPVGQICLTGSVWTTMAVSIERYISLILSKKSHFAAQCNKHYHLTYTMPLILATVLYNIPRFFEFSYNMELEDEDANGTDHHHHHHDDYDVTFSTEINEIRTNSVYLHLYLFLANLILVMVVPILVVLILNVKILKSIKLMQTQQVQNDSIPPKDFSASIMIVLIATIFLTCHFFHMFLNIIESTRNEDIFSDYHLVLMVDISHLALVVNSSVNVIIYSWRHKRFRKILFLHFRCIFSRLTCRPHQPHLSENESFLNNGEETVPSDEDIELDTLNTAVDTIA